MSIVIDEYEVINSNDKVERTDYGQETDDDDDTSDSLIKAFSPQNDHDLGEENQHVNRNEGLSSRRLQQEKFYIQKQEIKNVTTGRQNITVFSS